ncbi:MCP four helix bundle domain-containing protein, partial [Hydrogenophaga soli]
MFKNLRIATRLGLGFGVVLVLLISVAFIGITRLTHNQTNFDVAVNENAVKIKLANDMINQQNIIARAVRNMALLDDVAEMKKEEQRIHEARAAYKRANEGLDKLMRSTAETGAMDKVDTTHGTLVPLIDLAMSTALRGNRAEATRILLQDVRPPQTAFLKQINSMIELQEQQNAALVKQAQQDYDTAFRLMLTLTITATVLGMGLAWAVTRAITRPLAQSVAAANAIAAGDLSTRIDVTSSDETGQLLAAMQRMQATIQTLVDDMNRMSTEHDRGDIEVVMDGQKFQGTFRTMAEGVNNMVNGHIAVKKKAMACIQQFGEGNLDAPLEAFPGKKKFINDTIEQLRANLRRIVGEIQELTAAANKGDFSVKLELAGKQGFPRTLSELLNQLSDTVDTAFKDTIYVAAALEQGDLTKTVTRDYQGAFDQVKQSLNNTVAKLAQTIADVNATTDTIASATQQVSSTAQSLSQASSEQAASVEETS